MQEELESARPLLAQAAKDTEATMEQLKVPLLDRSPGQLLAQALVAKMGHSPTSHLQGTGPVAAGPC